jgi:hypothetical protein
MFVMQDIKRITNVEVAFRFELINSNQWDTDLSEDYKSLRANSHSWKLQKNCYYAQFAKLEVDSVVTCYEHRGFKLGY